MEFKLTSSTSIEMPLTFMYIMFDIIDFALSKLHEHTHV